MKDTLLKEEAPDQLQAESGSRAPTCYVSADWILENMWQFPNETWWEATLNGEHRQFVRIRLDIEKQEYVLDAVGIDRKYSESLWRYKGGDWQFLSHNYLIMSEHNLDDNDVLSALAPILLLANKTATPELIINALTNVLFTEAEAEHLKTKVKEYPKHYFLAI